MASGSLETVEFYGEEFLVSSEVLTPRAETEQVVDLVLSMAGLPFLPGVRAAARVLPERPVIVDVGTGSGCIAAILAKKIPEARVVATDVSREAVKIAKQNFSRLGVEIPLIISDLLENVKRGARVEGAARAKIEETIAGRFDETGRLVPDVVVANLPYVDRSWEWVDEEALAGDPEVALYAEDGGLAVIFELIEQCSERGVPWLVLEADPCQHERIEEFARGCGYRVEKKMGFAVGLKRRVG